VESAGVAYYYFGAEILFLEQALGQRRAEMRRDELTSQELRSAEEV